MTGPRSDDHDKPSYPVVKSEDEWRRLLHPEAYHVLRRGGTERPFSGEYEYTTTVGTYHCGACDVELFHSEHKFDSHCGWPSFYTPLAGDSVELLSDRSLGMVRIEVRCASCGSHLGHVFEGEGFDTPTDQRYCINSVSLRLKPDSDATGAS